MFFTQNKIIIFSLIILLAVGLAIFATMRNPEKSPEKTPVTTTTEKPPSQVMIAVPYLNEAPEDIWKGPWKNACEEATIVMVERFYLGDKSISIKDGKAFMQELFDIQDAKYGSNANSDADRMEYLIDNHTTFDGQVKRNPTLEDIKNELRNGHPVIALHRGFDLKNPHIPFLATGSSYHTTVIKGYDDVRGQFITNDPGDSIAGAGYRYDYKIFMNSLHDYQYNTRLADGSPVVIFSKKGK